MLILFDTYYGYNQIPMYEGDREKMIFNRSNKLALWDNVIQIEKCRTIYQRVMDQIFKQQIGWNMVVYIDYVIVKSDTTKQQTIDLIKGV